LQLDSACWHQKNEASTPRSQARSQLAPAASMITAQQQLVDEHTSQLEDVQEVNATVHVKVQQIEEILVAIRIAKLEDASLTTMI
jgi:hypothetical protein